jgi:hypothetical protein
MYQKVKVLNLKNKELQSLQINVEKKPLGRPRKFDAMLLITQKSK